MQTVFMNAEDVTLSLVGPGSRFVTPEGHAEVPDGKVGLVIHRGTDVVVVTGTAQQLRERVLDGLSLPVPADVPLFDVPDTAAELG